MYVTGPRGSSSEPRVTRTTLHTQLRPGQHPEANLQAFKNPITTTFFYRHALLHGLFLVLRANQKLIYRVLPSRCAMLYPVLKLFLQKPVKHDSEGTVYKR